jgi:hypothetical protein
MVTLASIAILASLFTPCTAWLDIVTRFWSKPEATTWEKAFTYTHNIATNLWQVYYSNVMTSRATVYAGQICVTAIALALICWCFYKTLKLIEGRHRTLMETNKEGGQSNTSAVHVHNTVQFRDRPRGGSRREGTSEPYQKVVMPIERYNDNTSMEAWLTRLELYLEPDFDIEDWARETLKLLSDKSLKNISPINRFTDQPNGYASLKEKLFISGEKVQLLFNKYAYFMRINYHNICLSMERNFRCAIT